MKILMINSVCGIRSTGRIVTDFATEKITAGHECWIAYGREDAPTAHQSYSHPIGTEWNVRWNAMKARIFDNEGFNARKETIRLLEWADQYDPDLLCLHNLHGYYLNLELLFNWIKKRPQMRVEWTLHDCWAFTGHCTHFSYVKCDQWKTGCHHCPQTNRYPAGILLDGSARNYERKKELFCGVRDMTLITPSQWLANLVKESFLKEYPVRIEHNTIDQNAFRPTPSAFLQRHGIQDKTVILGVASAWEERKGLADFVELARRLDDSFQIVLVGLTDQQRKRIPQSILCIPGTNSKEELAQIYTSASIFLNLSKEETFGLTTIEALSCGAVPVVYKGTACEEVVNCYGGIAVEQNLEAVLKAVYQIAGQSPEINK